MMLASPSGIGGITDLRRLVDTNRILTPCPSTPAVSPQEHRRTRRIA
jgi:hypothetical protein